MKIGIETLEGRLRLRFPRALFAGNQKYLSLNLADTVENRLVAEVKVRQIELSCYAFTFFARKPYGKDSRLRNIKFSCVTA